LDSRQETTARWSLRNGALQSFMLGCGEAYLTPFAVFLQASHTVIAYLASLPLFVGAIAQVAALRLLDGRRSRRRTVVACATGQALMWIAIFALPFFADPWAPPLLLAATIVYMFLGNIAPPIWNSWIGDLVPPGERGGFFGRLGRVNSLMTLAGVAAGGLVLQWGKQAARLWPAFGLIFGTAVLARLGSAAAAARIPDAPYPPPRPEDAFSFWDFLRRTPRSNFARFVVFVAALQAASGVAAPFFTPHMLQDLGFNYAQLLAATGVFFSAQFLTMQRWGALCDRVGNRRILQVTALVIPVLPILWILGPTFGTVLAIQVLAGVAWGGFQLAALNFIFDAVTPPKRARCVAYYNLMVNGGLLLGAAIGGWLAAHPPILPGDWHPRFPIQSIFLISALARLIPALGILPMVREVRPVKPSTPWGVLFHLIGVRPIGELESEPIAAERKTQDPGP
jgi:MFS family permease